MRALEVLMEQHAARLALHAHPLESRVELAARGAHEGLEGLRGRACEADAVAVSRTARRGRSKLQARQRRWPWWVRPTGASPHCLVIVGGEHAAVVAGDAGSSGARRGAGGGGRRHEIAPRACLARKFGENSGKRRTADLCAIRPDRHAKGAARIKRLLTLSL